MIYRTFSAFINLCKQSEPNNGKENTVTSATQPKNGKENTVTSIPNNPNISSNYPNPFNPSTTIAFSIPQAGNTRIKVYNLRGQKVKDLINTDLPKGYHKVVWDGTDSNNRNVSSGIYFFSLESGGKTSLRKALLMK